MNERNELMKSTPRPFSYEEGVNIILDANSIMVAKVTGERPYVYARGAFIVNACNSHDALLAGLEAMLAVSLEPGIQDVDEWKHAKREADIMAQAAIAAAKGG